MNSESTILLFEKSPYGNIDAIVESDDRTVYFYLQGDEKFGTRACWVRNLVTGPWALNKQDMEAGHPPVLPRIYTIKNDPGKAPTENSLKVVWFAEGNGAALFEAECLIAAIPPWSGLQGFHGYAAECSSANEICWPLPTEESFGQRITFCRTFWEEWKTKSPFLNWQPCLLELFAANFGTQEKYFAIDGGTFPPRGLAQFRSSQAITLATIGMALCPMPLVELVDDQPSTKRRIELAHQLPASASEDQIMAAAKRMSSLAGMPWREWTWFGNNHTCEWLGEYDKPYAGFFVPTSESTLLCKLPNLGQDQVNLLWILPLSNLEFGKIASNQITVQKLVSGK